MRARFLGWLMLCVLLGCTEENHGPDVTLDGAQPADGGVATRDGAVVASLDAALWPELTDASRDASGGQPDSKVDASGPFVDDFLSRVDAIIASTSAGTTCATSFRADASRGAEAVHSFIAAKRQTSLANIHEEPACTTSEQSCAGQFQHNIYKSNGVLGELLYPPSVELEQRAGVAQQTIWVPTIDGFTMNGDISFTAIVDGELIGILFFNDFQGCAR